MTARLIISLLMLSVAILSCNKSVRDLDTDMTAVEDHLYAQSAFVDVFRQVHRMAIEDSLLIEAGFATDLKDECLDTIYFTSAAQAVEKSLWLDWGQDSTRPNCEDDKLRYGLINVNINGFYPEDFSFMTIELFNYKVEEYTISGLFEVTYLGKTNGQRQYNMVIKNGEIKSDRGTAFWSCDWYMLQIEGSDLPKPFDDVFKVEGLIEGRGSKGNAFTVVNNGELFFDMRCKYAYGDDQTLTPENLLSRFINLNDDCDSRCSVTNLNGRWDVEIDY